jgi:hypothetical protein
MLQQTPPVSRHRRPSPLVLDAATHPHLLSDLPQLTSQLALEPVPAHAQMGLQPTYAASSRSKGSSTRNSQGSLYGYDHASDASSSIGGVAPRAQTYEAPTMGAVPAYTYQQLVPQYVTQPHHAPSPSSSVNWSETYASAPSTSYSTSPVYSAGVEMINPGSARSSVQYTQSIAVEPPTWTYQHVPVHVYPPEGPTSASAQVTEMVPIPSSRPAPANQHVPVPSGMYLATSAPQVQHIHAPERGHVTPPKERTDAGPGPVRNRVRRKVAIGRVRLPQPDTIPSNLTPTGGAEDPWKQMAQAQSISGAFTHSGVYGVDPSMSADPTRPWTGEAIVQPAPVMPVDSFPFGMAAAPIHRTTSIEGYYPPETATLYNTGSVSIPATVATSHVPLPLVSQLPPPLTMAPLTTSVLGTSMMQAGTPASLCASTFSSDDDDHNDRFSSDPAYDDYHGDKPFAPAAHISSRSDKASSLQFTTSTFDGFSRVPLVRTQTARQGMMKTEEDMEELQDVRSIYPSLGVHQGLPSTAASSSTSSNAGWPPTGPESHGRKRIIERATAMGTLPAHLDRGDYAMYGAKNNRPKLAIACQGCREKKLKSVFTLHSRLNVYADQSPPLPTTDAPANAPPA